MNKLSERLKEQRILNNLTQASLSKKMHIGQSTYASWETGKYVPDYEKLIWLCDFYNVSTDYILGRTDNPNNTSEHFVVSDNSSKYNSNTAENEKILNYYHRLDEENQDYIRGMMIKLHKESSEKKNSKNINVG